MRAALAVALALFASLPAVATPLAGAVRLDDAGPAPLSGRALANLAAFARLMAHVRFFHPSDQALRTDWARLAVAAVPRVERARDAGELAATLREVFEPVAPAVAIHRTGEGGAWRPPAPPRDPRPLVAGWRRAGLGLREHGPFEARRLLFALEDGRPPAGHPTPADVHEAELGGGVACRVPLGLWADHGGTLPARPLPTPAEPWRPLSADRRAVRLAGVAIAWGALQQFHPRLARGPHGWDAALPASLAEAAIAPDAAAHHRTLRRLAARLGDGQAAVTWSGMPPVFGPPIGCAWIEERLVVTAVGPGAEGVERGDEVLAVDGRAAGEVLAAELAMTAGATPARRRLLAARTLFWGPRDAPVELLLARSGRRPLRVALRRALPSNAQVVPPRPNAIAQLGRGRWYVDLARIDSRVWRRALPRLARASGLVLDLRGAEAGKLVPLVVSALADGPLRTPRFYVPRPRRPDEARPPLGYFAVTLPADGPRLTMPVVALCDAGTIGDAEIGAAVLRHHGLARIVGEPSAGTIGATEGIDLPGRFRLSWTGTTTHWYDDRPFMGVTPDLAVPRTHAAAREGRDELLEAAIAALDR